MLNINENRLKVVDDLLYLPYIHAYLMDNHYNKQFCKEMCACEIKNKHIEASAFCSS